MHHSTSEPQASDHNESSRHQDILSSIVRIFLESNLSIILIVFSVIIGAAALFIAAREEDPQIVVPLADVFVSFPGHSAAEVEQLVSVPLERALYQIDGVEYVYSMSRDDQAVITVRYYVGQDRERSLVKIFKKMQESQDQIPPGVAGWILKPVEIDDVPIVTLALTGGEGDSHQLRRVGEELVERFAAVPQVSRAMLSGGEPRVIAVELQSERLGGYHVSPLDVTRAIASANVALPAGDIARRDLVVRVEAGKCFASAEELQSLVIGVSQARPVYLKDVARIRDGAAETSNYVRHGWGPASSFVKHHGEPGNAIGEEHSAARPTGPASAAVVIALAKQKGANAVSVAERVQKTAEKLKQDVIPDNMQLVVTRNYGRTADEKVNELVEALGVAILIVIALLTLSMGWREALIVAVAVPVVFGLTLAVNLMFGYTINRVTLFALILALGLLVDDPIVDVENIARHFAQRRRATREIVLDAVAEIRPPLISATLAVIVSFLPMFFITGMMGPYMSPMALNVPVSMLMSMVVAFTITPWLSFHLLKAHYSPKHVGNQELPLSASHELYDPEEVKKSILYRFFRPLMVPLLRTRLRAVLFLIAILLLTIAAAGLGAMRAVPLKMLPFDNKNELLLVLDAEEGTTLERTSALVQEFEQKLATVPEVTDYSTYVGIPGPIDFNGLVRHYYLRTGPHFAEIRVNFVGKKHRQQQSHAIAMRLRKELQKLAEDTGLRLKIVELPPGPPVLSSLVAEVYGRPDHAYEELLDAGESVMARLKREPGIVDVDDMRESPLRKTTFVVDKEKAALHGISTLDVAQALQLAIQGDDDQLVRVEGERNPLRILVRLPRPDRSSLSSLSQLQLKGVSGNLVPLAELGEWHEERVGQTIYHKNLRRLAYVTAECVGRPPAECVIDVLWDRDTSKRLDAVGPSGEPPVRSEPRPLARRSYIFPGGGDAWTVPEGIEVDFAGEGEWKITLDVFRDLGLAFGAAVLMIYIILVAQTRSFAIPLVVMLAIPLTVLGIMPGFYVLSAFASEPVGGFADPAFFTATAMIGMIALAGIVTRDSIILVDFIDLTVKQGRSLIDAILESRVVRLRPILLTAGAALLSSIPITFDPIFSGLGWSLIFGLLASTLFTLFVIPTAYWLLTQRTVV
jgi:multidrug efflux pump subunit AcrB